MYKRFNRGEIVPQEIINSSNENHDKISFLVDVIVDQESKTIYPEKVIKKPNQAIILISSTKPSVVPIKMNYNISLLPIQFKNPEFINIISKYGLLNI